MKPCDYDTDNLNFGLQRTSALHFLSFLRIHTFQINQYTTFIIYQRERQLKAKAHYLSTTQYLQRAVPVPVDFHLNCQMGREIRWFEVSFDGTGIGDGQNFCSRRPKSAARTGMTLFSWSRELDDTSYKKASVKELACEDKCCLSSVSQRGKKENKLGDTVKPRTFGFLQYL